MAQTYNWQLGRRMSYPYPGTRPKLQFAAVFNLNRCIACQTCTMACKSTWTFGKGQEFMWWNNVESKPYGGYPQHWDVKTLSLLGPQSWSVEDKKDLVAPYGTYEGDTIFEAAEYRELHQEAVGYVPTDKEWRFPNIYEDTAKAHSSLSVKDAFTHGSQLPEHATWFFYLPRLCNHCTYPACLAACPRKAIYKRPEDGIVLLDQKRCRGYRKCVEQCPYKKPMFRGTTHISEKCIACYPRVEGKDPMSNGRPRETRCMAACVGRIRMQGLVKTAKNGWAEDPAHPLYYLVHVEKVALPLYPQFGTEPNIYYIPPRWAPRQYLRQMFGPGVDQAIEKYTAPSRKLLAVLQLFRAHQDIIFSFKTKEGKKVYETTINGKPWSMYDDTVIGYDKKGKEFIRTTVEEPIHIRPKEYVNSI
ncbi:MAG: nitrate oxidoreductase subunit beta [Candidatus Glassbacteria bacterium]|nr:nitrate oxidoreductase subunit beta [Candidatus Glassbacteria bacterium]